GRRRHCRKSRFSIRDTVPGRRRPGPRHRPGAVRFHLYSLAKNLLAGLRLALFLPVRASDYRVSGLDFVSLALSGFVAWVAVAEVVLWILVGWTLIASVRAVAVVMGTRRPQLYQGALAVGAMIAIAFFVFPETDVWLPSAAQDEEAGAGLADERAFHLQGQLI